MFGRDMHTRLWLENLKERGKIVVGKPNCRCKDNIKMYLSEKEWHNPDWVHLAAEDEDRYQWWTLVS